MAKYLDIQNEVISKYNITIDSHSTCRGRMHVHIKSRRICKWHPKNSLGSTFDLFHEIGHVMTYKTSMKRAESEYYATIWAIDMFKEYGLEIPEHTMHVYQRYILQEIARGMRRHGRGYWDMNIYKYAGIDKTIPDFLNELDNDWAACITPWIKKLYNV